MQTYAINKKKDMCHILKETHVPNTKRQTCAIYKKEYMCHIQKENMCHIK